MSLRTPLLSSQTARALALLTAAGLAGESAALASGFEKTVTWSGKYAGLADAASSIVGGAESLYFNPAGLGTADPGQISLNFSPTWAKFSGPFITGNSVDGDRLLVPVFGGVADYKVLPNLGVGIGLFVSGGTKAQFTGIDFSSLNPNFTEKADVRTDLSIVEASLGAGYEIIDGLRIGAAYRVTMVKGGLSTYQIGTANSTLTRISLDNLSDTNYGGFRAGLQYAPPAALWGLGLNFRSEVNFNAAGTATARTQVGAGPGAGTAFDQTTTASSASGTFPLQATIGAFSWLESARKTRIIAQYNFTQYAKDSQLGLGGTITAPVAFGGTVTDLSTTPFQLAWKNQQNLQLAAECLAIENWAIRAGYVYTSQVTDTNLARPQLTPPGPASTFTLGTGTTFLNKALSVDGALEYTTDSGDGNDSTKSNNPSGSYNANTFVVHLGATYNY